METLALEQLSKLQARITFKFPKQPTVPRRCNNFLIIQAR